MKLTVLGCHGGELPGCRSTCFLIDDRLAIDAGALTSALTIEQMSAVDDILLTHSHFDHVKDLPMFSDLVVGRRDSPVGIHSNKECIETLKLHLFNNTMWPDFTKIPSAKHPTFKMKPFESGATVKIGPYTVKSVEVSHPVESCGYIISDGKTTMAISGDTGPTEDFWKALNKADGVKVLLLECSFPNSMQELADVSGHLTPQTLATELKKFNRKDCEVLLYHLKPAFVDVLKQEVSSLPVRVLELSDVFEF